MHINRTHKFCRGVKQHLLHKITVILLCEKENHGYEINIYGNRESYSTLAGKADLMESVPVDCAGV